MIIGINASFLRKPDSGIGQVTNNFLKKLLEFKIQNSKFKNKDFKFILYLEEDADLDLPAGFEKRVFLPRFYRRDDLIRKIIWEKYLLPKEVQKDGCDVLFSMYQSAAILPTTNYQLPIRHIMLVHDTVWKIFPQYINNWRKRIYYKLVDKAIIQADKIMTVSENSKRDIMKYFQIPEDKMAVNYIDCDENFEKEIPNSKFQIPNSYIFYVGGFDVRKNVTVLVEAYGLLWNKWQKDKKYFPDLVLAGSFHKNLIPLVTDIPEEIKKVCEKYNLLAEKIKTIGFVEQKDLPTWYKNAKLFCYPSLYEGFGLPVLEAMNCGCPVIASNNSSIPEICSENSAVLINPKNTEEIAQALEKMLTDENLIREKIVQAKKEAEKFSWEKFVEDFLGMLKINSVHDEIHR